MIRLAIVGLTVVFAGLTVGCNSGTGGPRNDVELQTSTDTSKQGKGGTKTVELGMEDPNAKKKK